MADAVKPTAVGPAVKSAERALRILEVLASIGPAPFADLRRELAMPKSSLHALLSTMSSLGWVTHDPHGGFTLGYRARAIGIAGLDDSDVLALTDDLMTTLRDQVDETVHLARLDGRDILYLASKYSHHGLNVRFEIGRRLPAYVTALGKAMLAEVPEERLRDHLPAVLAPHTVKTIRSPAQLRVELTKARQLGYAEDDEESSLGLHCYAVAVRHGDLPLIAVSCSIPLVRLDDHRPADVVDALLSLKSNLLRRLKPVPDATS